MKLLRPGTVILVAVLLSTTLEAQVGGAAERWLRLENLEPGSGFG